MMLITARSGADMCPAYLTRRAWPLALMRSADRVPINFASSELCPVFGLSQSSVTTDMHQLLFTLAIAVAVLSRRPMVFRRQPPVVFYNPPAAP